MVIRQLTASAYMLQMASGPIGWATAAVSVVGTALTITEFMQATGE
jgi:hypothetical protein